MIESTIAVVFWEIGPFISIFILLLIGIGVGLSVDRHFAGKTEDDLRKKLENSEFLLNDRIDRISDLDAELDKLKNRKRDAHGRYVSDAPVNQADGYDS